MGFLDDIIEWLGDLSGFFYKIYLEVLDWVWPFWLAAEFFLDVSEVFADLSWAFSDFNDWVEWAKDEIEDILSWANIRSKIREWLDGIEDALDWFVDWWDNVTDVIGDWWEETLDDVKGLIAAAVEGLSALIAAWDTFWHELWPELVSRLENLAQLWDFFVTSVLPNLLDVTFLTEWWTDRVKDVLDLIDSGFKLREDFWEGWQEVRDTVLEFLDDPLEWLWSGFTDWFLGPE